MKGNRIGTWFMFGGLLLIVAALSLGVYNILEERRAAIAASEALVEVRAEIMEASDTAQASEVSEPEEDGDEEREMPTVAVNGADYIGVLDIPALELSLPVMRDWSYPALRRSPCRYQGSAYQDDLIVMAHNYERHFGKLLNLRAGDQVYFTDLYGTVFQYEVVELETLEKTAVEEMESGDWDLTLFTCTIGGETRVTVRCERM